MFFLHIAIITFYIWIYVSLKQRHFRILIVQRFLAFIVIYREHSAVGIRHLISENYKLIEGMFYNSLHRSSKDL